MIQQRAFREESWLERPLIGRLNWEAMAYIALIALALVSRLYDLGTRAMSHDESLHTYFSYNYAVGKGYTHTPLMHGPFLFHITALSYFLFGDSDFTSRLPYALLGVATVGMSWMFRRWLGRGGALIMAIALLVSPSNLYYSRYIRQEASIIVWNLLTIFATWRFMQTRNWKYVVLLTAALAMHAADKSTNFFAVAQLAVFLGLLYVAQALGPEAKKHGLLAGAFKFVAVFVALLLASSLVFEAVGRALMSALTITVNISESGVNLSGGAYVAIAVLAACSAAAGFGMCLLLRRFFGGWLAQSTEHTASFTPLVVLVTTTLLMSSAAILLILNPIWRAFTGGLLIDVNLLGNMGNLNNNVTVVITMLSLSMALIALSAALGVAWNWRRYLQILGLFLVITIPQFTSLFTNPGGVASGFVGQLGYWMAQQDVMRGSQPGYYYFVVVPLYEYAVLFGTILAAIYFAKRAISNRPFRTFDHEVDAPAANTSAAPDQPARTPATRSTAAELGLTEKTEATTRTINFILFELNINDTRKYFVDAKGNRVDHAEPEVVNRPALPAIDGGAVLGNVGMWFPLFLLWYTLSNWATYTAAGEKMPWLTIHIALPMAMLTGWFLQHVIQGGVAAWNRMDASRRLWLTAFSALGVVFGIQVLSSIGAWPDKADAQASAVATLAIKMILFAGSVYGAWRVTQASDSTTLVGRGLLLTFFVLLGVLTARTAIIASYINFDYTREFLFYAHGGHTVKTGLNQLSELSQRLTGGNTMKIGYDSDSSWPMSWYMRDFSNASLIGSELPANWQEYDAFIIGDYNKSRDNIINQLAGTYTQYKYMLVWWPMEDYKNLTTQNLTRNIGNTAWRAAIWDVIFNRDFRKYAAFHNIKSLTPEEWSPGHPYYLFIKNDVAARVWDYRSSALPPGQAPVPPPAAAANQGFRNTALGSVTVAGNDRFTVDYRNSRLIKVDASGEINFNIGGKGNATGKFDAPWGVAVDAQGNVLVADTFNHRIQRLDKDGNFLATWGVPGVTSAPGSGKTTQFFGPRDIAFDRNGKLLVVDTGNKRVQVFEPDGTFINQFGSEGSDAGQFREPVGLEIDAGGNIYIADMWNKRIQVFDPAYKFMRQFPVDEWAAMPQNELQAVDNKAYMASTAKALFVSSPKQRKVLVFGLDGRKLDTDLGLPNNVSPVGLAVRNNKLVISDANGGGVQEFDLPASLQ